MPRECSPLASQIKRKEPVVMRRRSPIVIGMDKARKTELGRLLDAYAMSITCGDDRGAANALVLLMDFRVCQ